MKSFRATLCFSKRINFFFSSFRVFLENWLHRLPSTSESILAISRDVEDKKREFSEYRRLLRALPGLCLVIRVTSRGYSIERTSRKEWAINQVLSVRHKKNRLISCHILLFGTSETQQVISLSRWFAEIPLNNFSTAAWHQWAFHSTDCYRQLPKMIKMIINMKFVIE